MVATDSNENPASPPRRFVRTLRRLATAVIVLGLLALAGRWLLWHGPVRDPEALPPALRVDLHCHVAGIGAGDSGCFVSGAMRGSWKFRRYLAAFGVEESELHERGDSLIFERLAAQVRASEWVDRVVVLALDGVIAEDGTLDEGRTEVYTPDDFVATGVARHPELLYGASVNPHRHDALERLERARERGAVLVKWLPSIQLVDPSDEVHLPYYEKLVELGLPLLCHTGDERSFTAAEDELADPARLELPLRTGVTVIAAHAATTGENEGKRNFDRLLEMIHEHPRLYADLSALTQINRLGHLDRVLEEEALRSRLLYGSDYPLISTMLVSAAYFPLHLTVEEIREIGAEDNTFDRDVMLKQALGVPAKVFARTAQVLGVEADD